MILLGKYPFLFFIAFVFIISCNEPEAPKSNEPIDKVDQGTSQINDSINQILNNIDQLDSPYENQARVTKFYKDFSSSQKVGDLYKYLSEMLFAGETSKVIELIEGNLKRSSLAELTEASKFIHDFEAICYLRLGEQENCLNNHNDQSCLVPISGAGVHNDKTGSEKAILKYEEILSKFPEDYQSKWLLNLAYMTLGRYPQDVPKEHLIIIPPKSESSFLENIGTKLQVDVFGLSGGSICDDFNGDGLIDIICSSWGSKGQVNYFENDGKGGFVDRSKSSGLSRVKGGLNMNHTDYNNDGHLDIYIFRGAWMSNLSMGILPNSLLQNNGDGTFSDVTISSGLYSVNPSQAGVWFDYNNDGHLDLFVANETTYASKVNFPCQFFVNQGDGTFIDVAPKLDLNKVGYFKGVNVGDINNDGWQDIYLSNLDGPNQLFIAKKNDQNTVQYQEISKTSNTSKPLESFSCWFFDYDNDGWQDIYVASFDRTAFEKQSEEFARDLLEKTTTVQKNRLYRNNGDETFEDVTDQLFKEKALSTMGSNFGDINNDGYLDFYLGTGAPDFKAVVPNRLFINQNARRFSDLTYTLGVGHVQKGHGISFADFNNDGTQEIHAVMGGAYQADKAANILFKNVNDKNNWVKISLEGTTSNKKAIGAKVILTGVNEEGDERTFHRTVGSGSSFGGNPLCIELGIGDVKKISKVEVNWPDTENVFKEYTGFTPNTKYVIKENGTIEKVEIKDFDFNLETKGEGHHHHHH